MYYSIMYKALWHDTSDDAQLWLKTWAELDSNTHLADLEQT